MRSTRRAAVLLLVTFLSGCTSYRAVADPAVALQASPNPVKKARVTLRSGESFEIQSPRVDGDSLRGVLAPGVWSGALADIKSVEIRRTDGAKTAAFTAGVVMAVVIVWEAVNMDYWLAGAP